MPPRRRRLDVPSKYGGDAGPLARRWPLKPGRPRSPGSANQPQQHTDLPTAPGQPGQAGIVARALSSHRAEHTLYSHAVGGTVYHFGQYELDTARRWLSHGGQQVHVEPQVADLLCHLVEHRDRVVPKEELAVTVGRGRTVSEAALATWLRTARLAIGDSATRQQFIRTVRRRGYQFVAHATVASTTPPATPSVRATAAGRTRRSSGSAGPPTAPASPTPSPATARPW